MPIYGFALAAQARNHKSACGFVGVPDRRSRYGRVRRCRARLAEWEQRDGSCGIALVKYALAAFFLIFGLIFTAVGLVRVTRRWRVARRGRRPTGAAVEVRPAPVNEGTVVFTPVVAFHAEDREVQITGLPTAPGTYQLGQQVPVCYPPAAPAEGVILTWREAVKAWAFVAAGAVFTGL